MTNTSGLGTQNQARTYLQVTAETVEKLWIMTSSSRIEGNYLDSLAQALGPLKS